MATAAAQVASQESCAIVECMRMTKGSAATKRAAAATCLFAAVACQPDVQPVNESNEVAEAEPAAPFPTAERPLDRSAVLTAAAKAGSAAALDEDDATEQRDLDGKMFEVRIRFGCAAGGPAAAAGSAKPGPFNVRFSDADRTLRLRATPDLTASNLAVATIAGEAIEHVEGFWMRRPWLLASGCPANSGKASASEASGLRVGIAEFSTSADARTDRRDGRPYEATKVLKWGALPSRQGYDLVLSGRLRKLTNGRVVSCRVVGPDVPPECIVSAHFDRVRVQTPDGKSTLGDWSR